MKHLEQDSPSIPAVTRRRRRGRHARVVVIASSLAIHGLVLMALNVRSDDLPTAPVDPAINVEITRLERPSLPESRSGRIERRNPDGNAADAPETIPGAPAAQPVVPEIATPEDRPRDGGDRRDDEIERSDQRARAGVQNALSRRFGCQDALRLTTAEQRRRCADQHAGALADDPSPMPKIALERSKELAIVANEKDFLQRPPKNGCGLTKPDGGFGIGCAWDF